MTIIQLLLAAIATAVLVWLAQSGKVPPPFPMVIYAIVVIIWLYLLLVFAGVAHLGSQRIS